MKLFGTLATVITAAAAAPSVLTTTPSKVDVKLQVVGNSEVKATIANNGKEDVRIFKPGSILDTSAVQKVKVAADDEHTHILHPPPRSFPGPPEENILQDGPRLVAGAYSRRTLIEVTFNIAQTARPLRGRHPQHKLAGFLSYAHGHGDKTLIGSIPYCSNTVSLDVNGAQAAKDHAAFAAKMKRSTLASAAGHAASSGSAQKMEEYFKASDDQTRQTVAGVFSRVEQECGSTTSGVANYYCTDVGNDCSGNILAYIVPSQSYMAYCDFYFHVDDLPPVTTSRHAEDQATTNIHEDTHLTQIQGTDDLGYGYDAIQGLPADQELNNADTFALFCQCHLRQLLRKRGHLL